MPGGDVAAPLTAGRQRVLTAALEMFSERGYAATSMRDLADRLGLQNASLYSHYPGGKEDLLQQALAPLLDGLDTLLALAPHLNAIGLHPWLQQYAEHLCAHPQATRVAGADLAVARQHAIGTRLAQQNARARQHIAARAGCSPTTAAGALGALWWPLICMPATEVNPGDAAVAAARLLTAGATARSGCA